MKTDTGLEALWKAVRELREDAQRLCHDYDLALSRIPEGHRESARNLVHYLALRRRDIRSLQVELAQWGLSSLGRLESHVMAALTSVAQGLEVLTAAEAHTTPLPNPPDFKIGDARLRAHAAELFGPRRREHNVHIMVTLATDAAGDPSLVEQLVEAGMDVARINTAHDEPAIWQRMIANVRQAEARTGRVCKILVDLEGPKLRTAALEPGPRVLKVGVERDLRGIVKRETLVHLVPPGATPAMGPALPLPSSMLALLQEGDVLAFDDIPGRHRELKVIERQGDAAVASTRQGFYVEPALPIHLLRQKRTIATGLIGALPPLASAIQLQPHDLVRVVRPDQLGQPAKTDENGHVLSPAIVPCSLPEVFQDVHVGDRIFFDDGKFAGVVREVSLDALSVEILRTPPGGSRLLADKGINLPDTITRLPALSGEDLAHLDFAVANADLIGMSFVRTVQDIEHLHRELESRGAGHVGVILKIETRQGFENLPDLLLAGLRRPPLGVMVARGDLGVELGFERMAEVQEQILWLCEAAHVPVVWATQVLDTLNKKGAPTRGEVTDAAMSARAECVMLNKGPHVVETVRFLADILLRMQDHHQKKTPMLRKLKVSEGRYG